MVTVTNPITFDIVASPGFDFDERMQEIIARRRTEARIRIIDEVLSDLDEPENQQYSHD